MLTVALGQFEIIPGRPDLNTNTMLSMIETARLQKADCIVFPEMSIPGYLLGDTWEQTAFLKDCEEYGQHIIQASSDICIIFGNVAIDWNKKNDDGRVRKYNACFVAYQGKALGDANFMYPFRIKTLQPNYREFDDSRHFYSLRKLSVELNTPLEDLLQPVEVFIKNERRNLACILCEDGWSDDYCVNPLSILQDNHPIDLVINISSSPYTLGKNGKRNRVFSRQAKELGIPLIYVNCTGLQNIGKTVYTFDGVSTAYDSNGSIIDFCPPFVNELKCVSVATKPSFTSPYDLNAIDDSQISSIYASLRYGVSRFLKSIGMSKVVIGISGGIDSAVSAALYVDILGPENVLLINMPSIYNSKTTKDLSSKLAENLGCQYTIIPIQEAVDHTIEQISGAVITNLSTDQRSSLKITPFITENIQARDRSARILAAAAAAFGGGFTCNANKSELSVGYSTLYGDQSGFLAALADLWKYQIYELAYYFNNHVYKKAVIPQEIIDLVPSAELSFDQAVDEGKGDPIRYPYHDFLFRAFMEHWHRATPEDILTWYQAGILEEKLGCSDISINQLFPNTAAFIEDLEKWWKLYTGMGVAKRIQAPPVMAVSRRAYGFDHREAQNGSYFTINYFKLKQQLLERKPI